MIKTYPDPGTVPEILLTFHKYQQLEVTGLVAIKVPALGKLTSGPGIGLQSSLIQTQKGDNRYLPGAKAQSDHVRE